VKARFAAVAIACLAAAPAGDAAKKQEFRAAMVRVLDARAGSFAALQRGTGGEIAGGRRWPAALTLVPFDPDRGCEVALLGVAARYECHAAAGRQDAWNTFAWLEEQIRASVPLEWSKKRHREGHAVLYRVADGTHPVVVLSIQSDDDVEFEVDLLVQR
jgi:hypothetical protein